MSLLKQLFLAICLFLVVAFSGSFVSSVENSREQLRGQLRSHAQDAATALGLSLTPHVDDPAMVQLMVSSIFDNRVGRTDSMKRLASARFSASTLRLSAPSSPRAPCSGMVSPYTRPAAEASSKNSCCFRVW